MKIITKYGNLIENVKQGWIVHGCNARGVMGGGFALAVKNKYPDAFQSYRKEFLENGLKLGANNIHIQNNNLAIVNAITQKDFGSDGKRYVSYDAIQSCFNDLNEKISAIESIPQEIHIPLIGCGLANGSWPIVSAIIEDTAKYPVTLWILP